MDKEIVTTQTPRLDVEINEILNGRKTNMQMPTIRLSIDGDHACALIGANLQEGEAEFDKVNPKDQTLKSPGWHAAMRAKKKLEDRLGLGQCGYYIPERL